MKTIIKDFRTDWTEIVQNSYHLHWEGGVIVTPLMFIFLTLTNEWGFWFTYFVAVLLNAGFWFMKEALWYFIGFEVEEGTIKPKPYNWFPKFAKWDWKDIRFSVYGAIPFSALVYFRIN